MFMLLSTVTSRFKVVERDMETQSSTLRLLAELRAPPFHSSKVLQQLQCSSSLQPNPTSQPTYRITHHVLRNRQPPTPATSRPSPQLRPSPLNSIHALERPLRRQRFLLTHRRRIIWKYGTSIPTWRSLVSVESGDGYTSGRGCGVQCTRKGYSDCASGC